MSEVRSVAPATPPRADRLRFVGQADVISTSAHYRVLRERAAENYELAELVELSNRADALFRTLATDKERICEAK